MSRNIGFVILHYEVMKETLACIESIQKYIDTDSYEIVVVDNASPNGSGKDLFERYQNEKQVHILLNQENLGFSAGNNVGFFYAKSLGCKFICMTNNDTELIQDDFYSCIKKEYEHSHCAVIGPEIHLLDGSVCEYPKKLLKYSELEIDRNRVKKLLFKNKWMIESLHLWIYNIISKIIGWKKIRHHFRGIPKADGRMEMVRIHGCCMIFTPTYIEHFNGLEVRTHFYGEEDILFVRLIRNGLLSVYQPNIKIFHHEEAATGASMGNKGRRKRRFIYEKHLQTLDMLQKMYEEDLESLSGYID